MRLLVLVNLAGLLLTMVLLQFHLDDYNSVYVSCVVALWTMGTSMCMGLHLDAAQYSMQADYVRIGLAVTLSLAVWASWGQDGLYAWLWGGEESAWLWQLVAGQTVIGAWLLLLLRKQVLKQHAELHNKTPLPVYEPHTGLGIA